MKARTMWVKEWLTRRHHFGHFDQLLTELHKEDPRDYINYLRITPDLFQEMVEKLSWKDHIHERTAGRGTQAGKHPSFHSYYKFVSKSTLQLQSWS